MRRLIFGLAFFSGGIVLIAGGYLAFIVGDAVSSGQRASAYRNVSGAMEPTLLIRETFTVVSVRGENGELMAIRRGDIVTHRWPPDTSKVFVKRIVGVPGDTLEMINGVLRLDGRDLSEPSAWHAEPGVDPSGNDFDWQRAYLVGPLARDTAGYRPSRNNWGPLFVPPGRYFVLGDNRDNSLDSRYWGFLTADDIIGRARRIYRSTDPTTGAIRWKRLGVRVE